MERNFSIEILEDNVLEVFDGVNPEPFLRQPHWPNGEAWANADEARAWGEQMVLSMTDETAELAGPSPEQPTTPRPVPLTGTDAIKFKLVNGIPLTEEEADLLLGSL